MLLIHCTCIGFMSSGYKLCKEAWFIIVAAHNKWPIDEMEKQYRLQRNEGTLLVRQYGKRRPETARLTVPAKLHERFITPGDCPYFLPGLVFVDEAHKVFKKEFKLIKSFQDYAMHDFSIFCLTGSMMTNYGLHKFSGWLGLQLWLTKRVGGARKRRTFP